LRVTDEQTGEQHILYSTPALELELKEHWKSWECGHEARDLRRHRASNGSLHVKEVCLRCGWRGQSIPRSAEHDSLPLEDGAIERQYEANKKKAHHAILQNHLDLQLKRTSEWHKKYEAYLASEAWQERRRLVFARAGGVCEGCRTRKATQVHHLSYQHFGDEFLFELVAICNECHSRIHASTDGETSDEAHLGDGDGEF